MTSLSAGACNSIVKCRPAAANACAIGCATCSEPGCAKIIPNGGVGIHTTAPAPPPEIVRPRSANDLLISLASVAASASPKGNAISSGVERGCWRIAAAIVSCCCCVMRRHASWLRNRSCSARASAASLSIIAVCSFALAARSFAWAAASLARAASARAASLLAWASTILRFASFCVASVISYPTHSGNKCRDYTDAAEGQRRDCRPSAYALPEWGGKRPHPPVLLGADFSQ